MEQNICTMIQPTAPTSPVLVVISDRAPLATARPMEAHSFADVMPAAKRVLEIGCGSGELARLVRRARPITHWSGVGVGPAPEEGGLDRYIDLASLNENGFNALSEPEPPDLIVLRDLSWLPRPSALLKQLGRLLTPGGQMLLAFDNAASHGMLSKALEGDLSTGLPADGDAWPEDDVAYPRAWTLPSVYKLLLDTGWSPTLVGQVEQQPTSAPLAEAITHAARLAGSPAGSGDLARKITTPIVRCTRPFDSAPRLSGAALFDVLVPTNHDTQHRLNVRQSPGLSEVGARVLTCRNAPNPAVALDAARRYLSQDWVLISHQDVYFPAGFGEQLNAALQSIPSEAAHRTILGFIGIGVNANRQPAPAGHVIDRFHQADHPASETGLSLDELAIVIHRDSLLRIDPTLGWHLWATDLCLQGVSAHQTLARVMRLPIFHNSHTGWTLPASFADSAERLVAKHSWMSPIHTLCGTLDAAFIASMRQKASTC